MNATSRVLPEFYLDKADRGALLSSMLGGDLRIALALCLFFAALALLFVALRARRLTSSAGATAATVAVVALCMSSRAGVAFDTIAWFFAALLLFVVESGDRYRWYVPVIVLVWSLCVDSGTIGAAIVLLRALGDLADERAFNTRIVQTLGVAFACCVASLFSAAGISFVFSAARALYFDMLLPGADRQPLWSSPLELSAVGVFAIVVIAAIGGIAQKKRTGEVAVFVALLVTAVLDARMAPFFAIAVAPALFARYAGILRIPSLVGAAFAAAAVIVAIAIPPPAANVTLLADLARDGKPHRVVCVRPSWCNAAALLRRDGITALTIGIPAASSPQDRALQKRIAEDTSAIAQELRAAHADAVVANEQTAAPALLVAEGGWRVAARDDAGRILIMRARVR